MYNPRKARIAQQFQLNGLPATRYLDALCGHSGKDFCEIVLVARDNRYYSLSLDPGLQYKLIAEKILSTFKFSE
ncbi:MAG: hypothetical protein JWL87_647 [Candidatus Adlerbacteria bacterium]|nr:hypothetical protein [Candidatus Adlerbacteria bacterium]